MANKHWIAAAVGKPGALHKALGIPQGQKIPASRLVPATHSKNKKVAAEARLAETLGKMHKK